MAVKRKTEEMDDVLAGQIPEAPAEEVQETYEEVLAENNIGRVGGKLGHSFSHNDPNAQAEAKERNEEKQLSKIGTNIRSNVEVRDGWMHVEKELLGERAMYYPESWEFWIKPATVDAIRNWSTVDEANVLNVDDVFNEILKYCLSIKTPMGPQPWSQINSWDKFFFVLLVREYTFKSGEQHIQFDEDCVNCDAPVTFRLDSQSLMYDMPDQEVLKYYDPETRSWHIDPTEFDVDENPITLYNPTLDKDANIKSWLIARVQENRNYKPDQAFMRFLGWLTPKISKDAEIAKRQIKDAQLKYKSWDMDMFNFMEEVIRNIIVTPGTNLSAICPSCGEEVTAQIRFPNGISDLFNFKRESRRFGKK